MIKKFEKFGRKFKVGDSVELITRIKLEDKDLLFLDGKKCHKIVEIKKGENVMKIKLEGKNKFYVADRFMICREKPDDDSQFEDDFEDDETIQNNDNVIDIDNDEYDYDDNRQYRPDELLFYVKRDEMGLVVYICPRRFFERNHYMHDNIGGHNVGHAIRQIRRGNGFRVYDVEEMEGIFSIINRANLNMNQIRQEFRNAGFQESQEFNDFIDAH